MEDLRSSDSTIKTFVRIEVDKKVAKFLKGSRSNYGFISEKAAGDAVEMSFMADDIEHHFSRWYLMFGDYAKILEPEALKTRVAELLTIQKERLLQ